MNKLAELKQKIQVSCPELMELAIGAKVRLKGMPEKQGIILEVFKERLVIRVGGVEWKQELHRNWEVFDPTFQLQHVLRAIDSKNGVNGCYAVEAGRGTILIWEHQKWQNTNLIWNFSVDLEGQSEETLHFLANILLK